MGTIEQVLGGYLNERNLNETYTTKLTNKDPPEAELMNPKSETNWLSIKQIDGSNREKSNFISKINISYLHMNSTI